MPCALCHDLHMTYRAMQDQASIVSIAMLVLHGLSTSVFGDRALLQTTDVSIQYHAPLLK